MAFFALTEIRVLYITVEVGFVLGVNAATTPMGQAMSYVCFCGSLRITPTVGISLIASHNNWDDNKFLRVLCSGTPYPVSSVAILPSVTDASAAACAMAAQIRSTSACEAERNFRCASRAWVASTRAS